MTMAPNSRQKNFKLHVIEGYRWSYGDGDDENLHSGIHDVNVDDLPEHVDSKILLNTVAANVGINLLDEDNNVVALTTDNDGQYVVRGVDICANCNGNGPTGEEGDFDRLGEGSVCKLCGYDNKEFDPGRPSETELREPEPIPTEAVPAPGRDPGEPTGE